MTKRLFLFVGVVIGFLLAAILHRPKLQRLTTLEANAAREKTRFAEYERQWQKEIGNLPFDERMEYELWEATMKLDNWMPEEDNPDAET